VPGGPQHPRELPKRAIEIRDVHKRDRAEDEVDGVVRKRQFVEVGLVELTLRDLLAGTREHSGRRVDADNGVT
jgi:hypothetical protein